MTKDEMISDAIKRSQKLGYWGRDYVAIYDEGNKEWSQAVAVIKKISPVHYEELKILQGRNYQAVVCRPKAVMLGGSLWVLIDKNTGEIIHSYPAALEK